MHTTHDYITKEPKLWLIHNGSFSGEILVRWEIAGSEKSFAYEWKVDGQALLTGNIIGSQVFWAFNEFIPQGDVPPWVIGRAVALALRTQLTRKIIGFVENL